jgi:hypothetical protein
MTNVFSLVEWLMFGPSPSENALPNPPFLPPEIQYWAGVIMRNACRKDESRGRRDGISGSSATNVSEGMCMCGDGDVNIRINSGGPENGREITIQDSLVAMRKKLSLCSNLVTKYSYSLPVMTNYY